MQKSWEVPDPLLSPDLVDTLGIHVRPVRNDVRDGRLPAGYLLKLIDLYLEGEG